MASGTLPGIALVSRLAFPRFLLWPWFKLPSFGDCGSHTRLGTDSPLPTQTSAKVGVPWVTAWAQRRRPVAAGSALGTCQWCLGGRWGSRKDGCTSNPVPVYRVRDREVFLSSNEVRLGEEKCRPDVQWIQGMEASGEDGEHLGMGLSVCFITCFTCAERKAWRLNLYVTPARAKSDSGLLMRPVLEGM